MKNYQTPLARARGLGSAREGLHDWWRQRVTAVALVPLGLWFAFSVALLPSASHAELVGWITVPWNTLLLLSFVLIAFYHTMLGLQVVIEDYVHLDWLKLAAILGVKLVTSFLTLAAVYAILRIVFA
ncbi:MULTISPECIES: succinate dehydrogenase, hydrophobic membrane anchor protein [Methylococcus]|uniref:Succinate dehydrogenase hydrophobic membrane anchor subunit n=1 Tax=Methylococcus capsulatus TaxID=414 RepID=A0ABZ2F526_METCP|nr:MULTISPECIES: succinate dehydrogenase, hydrophobic membrane anchor protein [Methylococcus]MDF9391846.1 succinate dehydrogenase, hydrophobic membrane anchor protein [Methylococcus capsulatus]